MDRKYQLQGGFAGIVLLLLMGLVVGGLATTSLVLERRNNGNLELPKAQPSPTIYIYESSNSPTPTTKILEESIIAKKKIETANAGGGSFECVGPDGKIFKTSESECKKLNDSWGKPMDYMVNCNVHSSCGGGSRYIKKSECNQSTCCQIGDKWFFYSSNEKCDQDQASGTPSNQYRYAIPTIQPWDGKISCSYSGGGYSYDFGKLTYAECSVKMDQYWKDQSQKTQTITPTTRVVSQANIDSCKAAVRTEVNSLVNGCFIKFQGSAAEGCEQTYRDRGAIQTQNCMNYGTHTTLTDTFPVPTAKCYATWDDYFIAHPYAGNAPIYGDVNMSGPPPCD